MGGLEIQRGHNPSPNMERTGRTMLDAVVASPRKREQSNEILTVAFEQHARSQYRGKPFGPRFEEVRAPGLIRVKSRSTSHRSSLHDVAIIVVHTNQLGSYPTSGARSLGHRYDFPMRGSATT